MKKMAAVVALLIVSTTTGFAQDVKHGRAVFARCEMCHSIGPGAKNKVGPELNGLDGRRAGTVPNFEYSDANKHSGIVWDEENFKEYVKYPRAFVRGTKMTFPGLQSQKQVDDLWAYVKQFDAKGNIKK
jgi:cytochrome c